MPGSGNPSDKEIHVAYSPRCEVCDLGKFSLPIIPRFHQHRGEFRHQMMKHGLQSVWLGPAPRGVPQVLAVLSLVWILTGCQTTRMKPVAWREQIKEELPVLGHRNWIVVADSAYPAQVSPGVEMVCTGAGQLEVVKAVLEELEACKHVRPIIYLDKELERVPEALAPGVGRYRKALSALLAGKQSSKVPHEELIAKLDQAGKTFKVLVLKTDLTLPYTSVFVELDCGYWNPAAEKELRRIIAE